MAGLHVLADDSPRIHAGSHARRAERQLRQRVRRDAHLRSEHRRHRRGVLAFLVGGDLASLVTAPVVYSLIVPLVVLDLWVAAYQAICFRAWGLARVRRRPYFAFDRRRLAYLNAVEQLNCAFCTYANGLFAYVREVAARTEQYWCPIRHARRVRDPHGRYPAFVPYGDAAAYRRELGPLRQALATEPHGVPHARRT
ncbi:MAG: hypothetical protein R2712_24455 [Vicinamibacterales bacterium]